MNTSAIHVREHCSVLAGPEKRLLERIARRLPAWVTPDGLTLLGLGSMIAAAAGFAATRATPWGSVVVVCALALNWFGDSLDGTVARVRRCERPRYGFYVDHAIDLAGTACLLVGLACSGRMHPLIAASVLAAYLLVAAESFLATHAGGVFRISFAGVGPTELRVLLAVGALFIGRQPPLAIPGLPPLWLFDVGGICAVVGLTIVFVVSAVRNAKALQRVESRL